MYMDERIKQRRESKEELYKQVVDAGGKPQRNNMFHCYQHQDKTASAWIKKSKEGYWYFRCFTCNIWADVWDIEAKNKGISIGELFKEHLGAVPVVKHQYYYKTIPELIDSLDYIVIEEINPYTNPDNGNVDLLVIRYLPRGGEKKVFLQAYQTEKGFIKKRPDGLLPLFNRSRIQDAGMVVFVEGEKCVRALTKLGIDATTGSGGASNGSSHDYKILAGKGVILWPDNDDAGKRYMMQVRDKLLELDPLPTVYQVDIAELELPQGGDVVDLIEFVKGEGGTDEDCKIQVDLVLSEASESNILESLDTLLDDMRAGRRSNLPILDMPILTHEARMMVNKKIGVVYGGAGFGKSLFINKLSDDLSLRDIKVARLELEDELELHLLRSFAQQAKRSELAIDEWHNQHPDESKELYEKYRPVLEHLAKSVISGENEEWDVKKLLQWTEDKLKQGAELVIIDPVSVVMSKEVWLDSHRLVWGLKRILANYPEGRVLLVAHPNDEGEVGGGKAYRRFCHTLLVLNRFKKPKNVRCLTFNGEERDFVAESSIGISKTRYGKGNGLEIAVKLNTETLCMEELGIIIADQSETNVRSSRKPSGRDLDAENRLYNGAID